MKIEMNSFGVLIVTPENMLEVYALKKYAEEAFVLQQDTKRAESAHWLGSKLIVKTHTVPDEVTTCSTQEN